MKLYIVMDTRDNDVKWSGSKRDCEKYIKNCNPRNKEYYVILKCIDKKED